VPAPLECPDLASWQTLFGEDAPPEEVELYERHLESCPACQERLDRGEVCREAWRRLGRRDGDPTLFPTDPWVLQVLDRLREGKGREPSSVGGAADLYFLRPGDRPGVLGTLGAYEVREVIGQGGMGVVLKAFDPGLHRLVAIKVLSPALAGSATARRRFTREAQAAAAVCHDHVVAVHGVSEADGLPYLVMQYVAGESLQQRLDRTGPLPVEETVRIGMQSASGLAAAHAQGLIHRDVKPANLLLENGLARVKITDFGLARTADDVGLTQTGVVAGTPPYMAPEQARGEAVDHRADLFSLGSVLYACCTGRPPFRGSTPLAVLRQVSEQAPPPVRSLNPEVPAWLEALIARLMAKDPAQRFQSAAAVAVLLEGYLAHLRQPATVPAPELSPPPAGESPRPATPGFWTRVAPRFRRPLGLAALVLLALGLAVGLLELRPTGPAAVPVRRLQGHTGPVHNVRFTPDGRRLVSGSGWPQGDGTVRVWDVESGRERNRVTVPGSVHSLDLTPDGRFALVGLSTGQVLYLEVETGQVVRTLKVHGGPVGWVALAADGAHGFSTSDEGTARMWDLADGQELARFDVQSKVARGGALLPDGRRLLTGDSAGMLQLWDITTGQEVKQIPMGGAWMIDALRLTPDGRQVLVSGVAGVRLYDLETGQEVRHFQEEHEEVHQADLSPDGRRLLAGSFDGKVRLWDFQTGELLQVLGSHNGFVFSVAFSPDGRLAASGGGGENEGGNLVRGTDHDIRLWELGPPSAAAAAPAKAGGKRWLAAAGLVGLVLTVAACVWLFVRHGHRAAGPAGAPAQPPATPAPISCTCTGCGKKLKAGAHLAGKKVKCPQCGQPVLVPGARASEPPPAAVRAKGKFRFALVLLGIGLAGLTLAVVFLVGWRSIPPQPRQRPSFVNVTLGDEFVPEVEESGFHFQEFYRGQPFRWTDGHARLVIPTDRTKPPEALLVRFTANRAPGVKKPRVSIVVNGRSLFEGDIPLARPWENVFDLRGIDLGEQVVLEVISDTFSPQGGKVASDDPRQLGVQVMGIKLLRAGEEPAPDPVRVIGPQAGLGEPHPRVVAFGAVTSDGKTLVSGGWDGTVKVWDVAANAERDNQPGAGPDLNALAVSPDGKTLAAVTRDRVVRVRDLDTGAGRGAFAGHKGQVLALAYSPDGKTLASVGDDNVNAGELKLWDLADGTERVPIEPFPFRLWGVAHAPDGKSVAVVGADRTAQVVDANTGKVLTSLPLPFYGRHVAFSPDGKLLAVAYGQDGRVRLYELDGGRPRPDFQVAGGKRVFGVSFAPDGKRLLTPAADGATTLWDVSTPQARALARLEGHEGPVRFALFFPDGQTVATGGEDGTVRLWNVAGPE
jgi:eukaryotic-like serine/threonine-protein kinase